VKVGQARGLIGWPPGFRADIAIKNPCDGRFLRRKNTLTI